VDAGAGAEEGVGADDETGAEEVATGDLDGVGENNLSSIVGPKRAFHAAAAAAAAAVAEETCGDGEVVEVEGEGLEGCTAD
jgi:hypothetical protein